MQHVTLFALVILHGFKTWKTVSWSVHVKKAWKLVLLLNCLFLGEVKL